MSTFWSIWISVIVLVVVFGCAWLLFATRKSQTTDVETDRTMGHSFDGIEEYDNPLPKWWFYLFVATVIFSLGYLALYPGLGNFKGLLGWTSTNQWEAEVAAADEKYGPIYAQFGQTPVVELSKNEDALKIGQRLFANNCAVCHGTAARGQVGFPNLTDGDWMWGGSPEAILETLRNGRMGNMPAKGVMPNMTNEQVDQVVNYVLSFSGREKDAAAAEAGKAVFAQGCVACHGPEGKGMQALGAPNLTDNIWLYGSNYEWIRETVLHGRVNEMPAQSGRLSNDQIQILAAYVYSLSN
ncbi:MULTISPECIES: cytochrome-c oxidase, cbb3-type subunit III [Marinobacter]|uniref:Cbb3-type cytochrome c oxidase subunit n=1 Tax=Marinobacter xiaoshiensis TaxID=3073652 RepID=A0ABU2HFD0_9GAMM|nr:MULTISPECIES: cytochrome-c oxidase, cbb3-type subunit III [unclassified Marinobacter]MBK1885797.1 cytochrome-c oxidase, cbb3-type subunit III [Marinobacter sp. DY40_1A1]MDS1309787.1 cytochrome-c oxidase, cbb3-type subunit III [Marinobacter sp. F60267]